MANLSITLSKLRFSMESKMAVLATRITRRLHTKGLGAKC